VVVVDQDPAAVVGRVGPETDITGSLDANVLTASEAQVEDVAQRMLASAAAPDSVVPGAVIRLGDPTLVDGHVVYSATGSGLVYGLAVPVPELQEEVRSKTIEEAQRILGEYGTATISLSPDFLPTLPDDPTRIEIHPGPPPPGATPIPMSSPTPAVSASPSSSGDVAPMASDAAITPLPSIGPTGGASQVPAA
jgi:hypothetical protein